MCCKSILFSTEKKKTLNFIAQLVGYLKYRNIKYGSLSYKVFVIH